MFARRKPTLSLLVAGAVAAALIAAGGCKDSSDTMTGPAMASAAVNITGSWNGTFHSGSAGCSTVPMSITFSQNGNAIAGNFTTPSCGLANGHFHGILTGRDLTGQVEMQGCTGGAVAGSVSADGRSIAFSMDDLKKPLVTGDQVVAPGGDGTLSK